MPQIEISPGDYLNSYVKPLADKVGAGGAFNAFKTAIGLVVDLDEDISFNIPNPFPAPPGSEGGESDNPPNLLPPIPSLQPINPEAALKAIAKAVREAEKLLNVENLAIGGASAEVSLIVDIGGVAGANTTFKINIGPTPRP